MMFDILNSHQPCTARMMSAQLTLLDPCSAYINSLSLRRQMNVAKGGRHHLLSNQAHISRIQEWHLALCFGDFQSFLEFQPNWNTVVLVKKIYVLLILFPSECIHLYNILDQNVYHWSPFYQSPCFYNSSGISFIDIWEIISLLVNKIGKLKCDPSIILLP